MLDFLLGPSKALQPQCILNLSLDPAILKLQTITQGNWRRRWRPTLVLMPGKSRGRGSLVGCSPRGRTESDTTERLHFHFSPSCTGEGDGNPPQCSCLEDPRDGGAWWAAIYGVAQSRTRPRRLSGGSSQRKQGAESQGKEYKNGVRSWRRGPGVTASGLPRRKHCTHRR